MTLFITVTGVSLPALIGSQPLFPTLDLSLLSLDGYINHKLESTIAPAQYKRLVSKHTYLKDMQKYLADAFHTHHIRIIGDENCQKVTFLIVFPENDLFISFLVSDR